MRAARAKRGANLICFVWAASISPRYSARQITYESNINPRPGHCVPRLGPPSDVVYLYSSKAFRPGKEVVGVGSYPSEVLSRTAATIYNDANRFATDSLICLNTRACHILADVEDAFVGVHTRTPSD